MVNGKYYYVDDHIRQMTTVKNTKKWFGFTGSGVLMPVFGQLAGSSGVLMPVFGQLARNSGVLMPVFA